MTEKRIAVVLNELGEREVKPFAELWMKRAQGIAYFNCKSVEVDGPHLKMVVDYATLNPVDFELRIPHLFVRGIVSAADNVRLARLGFM